MGMEDRVSRLEVEFEHVRKDLDEIRHDQKEILKTLGVLRGEFRTEIAKRPTTGQFWGIIAVVAGLALTTVVLIVGGISVSLQYLAG